MSDKPLKVGDSNTLEKHLGSKLFQKFLQKEGSKLNEVSIIPQQKPEKFEVKPKSTPNPFEPEDYPEPKQKPPAPKPSSKAPQVTNNPSPKPMRRDYSPPVLREEIYVEPSNYSPDSQNASVSKQNSLRFSDYPEEKQSRSKWQEPEPYQRFKEEPCQKYKEEPYQGDFFSRDSELKGFSDYIPPGESFVYYESIPDNPPPAKAKPKPQTYVPYYPPIDPLIALKSNHQEVKELEEILREKEEDILRYKQDLENIRQDYADLEEKLADLGDVERKLKNLRVERDMLDRKNRGLEDENIDLHRQLDIVSEDLENMRFKVEDVERASRNRVQDLERELRGCKDRVSDLERDLTREKDKNSNASRGKKKDRGYNDDYRNEEEFYDDYSPYEEKRDKYQYFDDDQRKPQKKRNEPEVYPDRSKKSDNEFYYEKGQQDRGYPDRGYQDKGFSDRGYQEKGFSDRGYQENYEKNSKPEKISEQVKARVGATNSSSVSSVLNWGEKPKKNDEVLNIENKILSLQIEKKRFEEELAKIPEHGKKIAVIRRREEIENELAGIHAGIASLKIKVKQIQS